MSVMPSFLDIKSRSCVVSPSECPGLDRRLASTLGLLVHVLLESIMLGRKSGGSEEVVTKPKRQRKTKNNNYFQLTNRANVWLWCITEGSGDGFLPVQVLENGFIRIVCFHDRNGCSFRATANLITESWHARMKEQRCGLVLSLR